MATYHQAPPHQQPMFATNGTAGGPFAQMSPLATGDGVSSSANAYFPPTGPNDDGIGRGSERNPQRRAGRNWLPYRGQAGLIIAIDLGTTYSGASYCILTPGKTPVIEDVKSFPGQATSGSKVPSVIMYNSAGQPCLYGAEAADGAAADKALDQGGQAARWWKLHLKPPHLTLISDGQAPELDPLPFGIRAETIASHFLAYMASCVGAYVTSRHASGLDILQNHAESIRYVITIPNGWELSQQQTLRQACIEAGLVTPDRAHTIEFLPEAEASVNFCVQSSSSNDWLEHEDLQLVVCDAGGGTIDISTYEVQETHPRLLLSETSASDCLIAGSTTVDRRAREAIQQRLRGTDWDNPADLQDLQLRFCAAIKETFSDRNEEQFLGIGNQGLNNEDLRIRRGKLVFQGEEVAALFEPSIRAAEASIRERVKKSRPGIAATTVAMVGGFSESVYFRKELQARLGGLARLCKPDEATAKAVASGAVAWHIDGVVATRVARMTYGIRCSTLFRESRPTHIQRRVKAFTGNDGKARLPHSFGAILQRGERGHEDAEHIESFFVTWAAGQPLIKDASLIVYRGHEDKAPEFMDQGGFEELCKFRIDMEPFRPMLQTRRGANGQTYTYAPVRLAMRLNATEIQAQVLFEHGDKTYRSPATVVTDTHTDAA